MAQVTGHDAASLTPTGPDDLVEQLNRAAARWVLWPWLASIVIIIGLLTMVVPPLGLAILLLGLAGVAWFALWEKARRTVAVFYEVDGPAAVWYDQMVTGYGSMSTLGGAWRIRESGSLETTYQRKVNSGASHLVNRAPAQFSTAPPPTLATNISVPTVTCGNDALLFLPDRVLVRSGRRWSDLLYSDVRVSAKASRFIESGAVPRDGTQVATTWQYVNVKGGPDRRYKDNRQLPVMLYGTIEITSPAGLRWIVDCSRVDLATWKAEILTYAARPPAQVQPVVVAQVSARPSAPPRADHSRSPFARPGGRGELFAYANLFNRAPALIDHDGPFAIVDVETTGFSPGSGDRVIEIAIARVDRHGRIEDEFATLINPGDRDTGAVFIHGITSEAVRDAPRFRDVAGEIVRRLDGCVVVAHNAAFEERFLAAEFALAGLHLGRVPALCSLWLAQQTFTTPNHKLITLGRHIGLSMTDAHAALGDVRAVAALLPNMLIRYPEKLGYSCNPLSAATVEALPMGTVHLRTRAAGLRRGDAGWMATLLARLPMSAAEAGDAEAERYLACLTDALADGRIVGDEARALANLAGSAGLGAAQVARLNERFLESLREAAFEDDVLTSAELKGLLAAAKALGVPSYFDDLSVGAAPPSLAVTGDIAGQQRGGGAGVTVQVRQKRCGHCRQPGHYRSRCPGLAEAE